MTRVGVRWTIGDVSEQGFAALHLSVWGAHRLLGQAARYAVCVNTIEVREARQRAGPLPPAVEWRAVTRAELPSWARARVDARMAEGVMWKLAPVRVFPDLHELALDNDCILWGVPVAMRRWLTDERACLLADDVRACFGRFAHLCGPEPRNSGLRGVPPGFDLEAALERVLASVGGTLHSELDEQGLQVAALTRSAASLHAVGVDEVSICSPFAPHVPNLGTAGAHFVGLNARSLGWTYDGRPGEAYVREHYERQRPLLERLVREATPLELEPAARLGRTGT